MKRAFSATVLTVCAAAALQAQLPRPAAVAREWRQQHERAIVDEFLALLAIPNVSSDRPNIQRNAEAIRDALAKRNVDARLVSVAGGSPIVYGEIRTPGATRTIGFYAHYDGQPINASEWSTPPFQPTLRDRTLDAGGRTIPLPPAGTPFDPEARIYARGAADDKAPIIAQLTALDALRNAGVMLRSNIKFMFEGEEEAGSTNLRRTLDANKTLFTADLWLMCDGPVHQTRRQALYFGARDWNSPRRHGVRTEARAAQRPLRELGAQSCADARATARVDEGTVRPRRGRRLLQRHHAVERRGAESARGRAERRR
jgi:hypothetical protein